MRRMTQRAPRILLCGDVLGRLDQLYKRFSSVNKSNGPFDALFCVGQFFPNDDSGVKEVKEYIDGIKEIPLPTYFIGNYGEQAFELLAPAYAKAKNLGLVVDPIAVCSNLYWLKGSGVIVVKGLRIAYLSGKSDPSVYEDAKGASEIGAFHQDDVDALRALADDPHVVDLFLTNDWPRGVLTGSNAQNRPAGSDQITGNPIIAELTAELKPRYHIAASEGSFYSREPYSSQAASHVTRFIALGVVGNEKKQKYLHALSPTPASNLSPEELAVIPPNTTLSPYQDLNFAESQPSRKRFSTEFTTTSNSEGQYWRYDSSSDAKKQKRVQRPCFEFISKGSCSRGERCKFNHSVPRNSCYDFITKGSCDRGSECKFQHVSEENIQTRDGERLPAGVCFNFINKGTCEKGANCRFSHTLENRPPSSSPCWFCLSSPNVETHLVISVGDHCYCALAKGPLLESHMLIIPIEHLPSTASVSREAENELQTYKDALRRLFKSQGKAMIIFERYIFLRAGTHAHLQVIPVPFSTESALCDTFESAAKELGFEFEVFPDGNQNSQLKRLLDGVNYFLVELPDGKILAHPFAAGEKMPMQFGREVVANLLGMPEKADWKTCKLSKEEEVELVEDLKKQFQPFDPMQ